MISQLVRWCVQNRFLVLTAYFGISIAGIISIFKTPMDALPDLSENQVIVLTDWMGRSPQEVEDQITYPLSASLQGLAGVRVVRAQSDFGFSMVKVIFNDQVDIYFARARVLERLNSLPFKLPDNVVPTMGPDATGLGWVYQYYLDDSEARKAGHAYDLGELRSTQDWLIRYQLNSVPGVAEVAGIGGYVREYQIDVHPERLRAYNLPLAQVLATVTGSNRNVGGGVYEQNGREHVVRGLALVQTLDDLRNTSVGYSNGLPVRLKDVATIQLGPSPRRGILDFGGKEVVGGTIVMRYGESTVDVIQRVKAKIEEIQPALPPGIKIRSFYDRSELIERAISTLRITLVEEIILVTLAHLLFLRHFRSILIVTVPLPLSILISFLFMQLFHVSSNIMSLAGIAIAIGVLVDAGIVITEAVMREAFLVQQGKRPGLRYPEDLPTIVSNASALVARPIFYAMAIIILAFVPIFALHGQEGKLFIPLALTKTFAMIGATLLSVTLVPVLCTILIRGKLHDESENGLMIFLLRLYLPVLRWALNHRKVVLSGAAAILAISLFIASRFGWEFMPPLNERAVLFMPTTIPGSSIVEVHQTMAEQDRILASIPEVESVAGKLGRAQTATDPAPISMLETTIMLKPEEEWRPGVTLISLREEMRQKMSKFPGYIPAFLQPIENRILMLATDLRTQVGVKIFGEDLTQLEKLAQEIRKVVETVPGATDLYAEHVSTATYLEIEVKREEAARYGVPVPEILETIETALGGKELSTTIEGRKRFPIRVRYPRELRNSPDALRDILVTSLNGQNIALGKVAELRLVNGPSTISSENGLLRVYVQCNVRNRDLGGFVREIQAKIAKEVKFPPGYYFTLSGQYENILRFWKSMSLVFPMVLFIIFILLYLIYRSYLEAAHVLLAVPFALSGGVILQWIMGYPFSVAVWVGYIALFGTAVQTGVVMVIYLEEAVRRRREERGALFTLSDLRESIIEGAALRLRPKVMTVSTVVASLFVIMIPFLSGERTGIEVMRPIAVPVIGGMISSLLHILIVTPVIFEWLQSKGHAKPPSAVASEHTADPS